MKGAGVCSLNREVHYIMWSLNRVSGVYKIMQFVYFKTTKLNIKIITSPILGMKLVDWHTYF